MKHRHTATTAALALVALALSAAPAAAQTGNEVIYQTNTYRASHGLRPVQYNAVLTAAALGHAEAMARSGTMAHTLGGSTMTSRLARSGYSFSAAGENVAYGQTNAREVVADWMSSPGHRSNILTPTYTQIGVGISRGGDGRLYYCQVFGTPR